MPSFEQYFACATGHSPFPFQRDFAGEGREDWRGAQGPPALVDVPTGLGKTAMAVLGWLWRRRFADETVRRLTPRRLVYCLPMRVLVEQTRDSAAGWFRNLRDAGLLAEEVPVHVFMGGEDGPGWDLFPERDAVILGTQDMLLSRALNRGYAAGRARWPMHFGLLNTDCLWVFDEVQLMGSGLATTAQLEAFRHMMAGDGEPKGNGCTSVWMSATLRPDWLGTVDFKGRIDESGRIDAKATLSLSEEDHKDAQVAARWNAKKPLAKAGAVVPEKAEAKAFGPLANEVLHTHKPGTRTIVVVNTVKRACTLVEALRKADPSTAAKATGGRTRGAASTVPAATSAPPTYVLIHSRFRPPDRERRVNEALADVDPSGPGTIIVSTQVIEAGVHMSAATLFTELAPWSSMVQRFGRCNRLGELNSYASVRWIDVPESDAGAEKVRHPYELADLRAAAEELATLGDVGPGSLHQHRLSLDHTRMSALFPHRSVHVIRRRDLLGLFDTTPDLTGNEIDIDRYVREVEETDVRVFWRDYGDPDPKKQGATPNDINGEGRSGGEARVEPSPRRHELCPVPIGEFKEFVKGHGRTVWRWGFTECRWELADPASIVPGGVYLVHVGAGGYSAERGWSGDSDDTPSLDGTPSHTESKPPEGYDDDRATWLGVWQTLSGHSDAVVGQVDELVRALGISGGLGVVLREAARWHDLGKAHGEFQKALNKGLADAGEVWAKSPGSSKRYERRHFRHELASALAVLQRPHESLRALRDEDLDLVAYLIAAHHGKVRLSIRSMPNEQRPDPRRDDHGRERRFARGVWDGDTLASVDLGGGVTSPEMTLSLEPMELGLCELPPFEGQPSWAERVLRLRDRFGPFRLAYLEALLRAADARASAAASNAGQAAPESAGVSHG
ncbi:MAG: CRISPR-associated endonuclease Cas3'' [Phycisphaeraceae bacterium]|nr:MAG: CRISPR-associated endonuclease Cas3'' [Phycisphaeraceae bacterium]